MVLPSGWNEAKNFYWGKIRKKKVGGAASIGGRTTAGVVGSGGPFIFQLIRR